MNKLFTKIVGAALGLTMAIGVGVAIGSVKKETTLVEAAGSTTATYSVKTTSFGSGETASGITGTFTDNQNNVWSYKRTLKSGSAYTGSLNNGYLQLGKNGGVDNLDLTLTLTNKIVTYVGVDCASYNNAHNVAITVGSTTYLAKTATPKWSNNSGGVKSGTGTSSGEIKISFTDGTRAMYVKSIEIRYEDSTPSYFSVSYDGNGNTSGSVPTDATQYPSAGTGTCTVKGNTGNLAKTNHTFLGWNTNQSATTAQYVGGNTFTVTDNTTLFAIWQENDSITPKSASFTVAQGGTLDLTTCVTTTGTGALSFTAPSNSYFSISGTTLSATQTTGGPITVTGHKGSETATFGVSVVQQVVFSKFTGTFDEGTYLITYSNGALKNTITSSRADYTDVTPVNDKITDPDDSLVWKIEEATSGTYTGYSIYNEKVEKYLASTNSNNQAALSATLTSNCIWTVSGTSTYEFTNSARNGAGSNNKYLRKNGTYGFACYASGTGGTLTLYAAPAVDTLKSIAVVGATNSFKDGDKFTFDGSVTATYSISGTTGHTGITTGLSFKVGNTDYIPGTTELTRGEYTVVVSYTDGVKTVSVDWPITVGYHDAESVTIDAASEITVQKGYDTTFTATVSPSNAHNVVIWSVTDLEGNPTSLADIDPDSGYFLASDSDSGDVKVTATSDDNKASASIIVHISGDPILIINHSSANLYYPLDSSFALSVSPENFPEGTITYEWSSDAPGVVTVSSTSSSATANILGAGTAQVTATAKISGSVVASATCDFNITKTRSVFEDIISSSSYDFSSVAYDSTALDNEDIAVISNCFNEESISEPTVTIGDYVYAGNGTGGAYPSQGGFIKLGKSGNGGTLTFDFGTTTITRVVVSAQTWNGTEGSVSINGTAPSKNAGASSYADVELSGLEATQIAITSTGRVFVKSIAFYSEQEGQQIGKTTDVVNLEIFITNCMHMDDYPGTEGQAGPGWCMNDDEHHYYSTAKSAFNNTLNDHQRKLFTSNSAYTAEWARLSAWATANGDSLNSSNQLANARISPLANIVGNTNTIAIIVVISMISITCIGGYFFLRKRKEN